MNVGGGAEDAGDMSTTKGDEIKPITVPTPYLLFLGDVAEIQFAKTALGLRDWARHLCIGEFSSGGDATIGLPKLSPAAAFERGARALVIGVASPGGSIPAQWLPSLIEAMNAGLDIVSGMHARLSSFPELASAAEASGRRLIDVRVPPASLPVGTGRKRSGKRLLTVGTDCALGKKYTALALARAFAARGIDADFRATGQTGILIAGSGMPMDAVISDFESGAAELLSPDAAPDHWDIIEGQGSLFHPGYAAVSLGLLHGSQPDTFVVCHEPGRGTIVGLPDFPIPSIFEVIELTIMLGRRTNPAIRCAGVSLNTQAMDEVAAAAYCREQAQILGLPVADPVRGGPLFDALVDAILS